MKKIIVVGAGISGLSAAIYAQRSGFDVTICEQHSIPGGMCTSWRRKGYLFEGSVHWLTGSSPKTQCYQLWKETGALDDTVKVTLPEPFCGVEWEGKTIPLYRDFTKTAEELAVLSPADKNRLRRLVRDIKAFSAVEMPIYDIRGVKAQNPMRMNIVSLFKMLAALPVIGRMGKISCKEFAEQFAHPGIQFLLRFLPDEHSAVSLIGTLSTLDSGDGGIPEGGSLAIADRMARTFTSLGGEMLLSTKVKKVTIENGAATGVELEDRFLAADAIIVTQEAIAAQEQLFDPPLHEPWLDKIRRETKPTVCTFVSAGIRSEIIGPPWFSWMLEEPIHFAGKALTSISFNIYPGGGGYAPEGCSVLTSALRGDTYDFWKKAKELGRYEEEKEKLDRQLRAAICKKFPQAEGNIEVMDIATPLTYERYTGAHHGSWMTITGAGDKMKMYPGFVKNTGGLFFAGHRLMPPGGLPVAVFTGRNAAQMVCRHFNVMFKNS